MSTNYVDKVYDVVKFESVGMDAIYDDYIIHLVGILGLNLLREHRLVESCGEINGRTLYTLCRKEES